MTATARALGVLALLAGFVVTIAVGALLVAAEVTGQVTMDHRLAAATLAVSCALLAVGAAAVDDAR